MEPKPLDHRHGGKRSSRVSRHHGSPGTCKGELPSSIEHTEGTPQEAVGATWRLTSSQQSQLRAMYHSHHDEINTFWGIYRLLQECNISASPPLVEDALGRLHLSVTSQGFLISADDFVELAATIMFDPHFEEMFYEKDEAVLALALAGEGDFIASLGHKSQRTSQQKDSLFALLPQLATDLITCSEGDFSGVLQYLEPERLSRPSSTSQAPLERITRGHDLSRHVLGTARNIDARVNDPAQDSALLSMTSTSLLAPLPSEAVRKGSNVSKLIHTIVKVRRSFAHSLDFSSKQKTSETECRETDAYTELTQSQQASPASPQERARRSICFIEETVAALQTATSDLRGIVTEDEILKAEQHRRELELRTSALLARRQSVEQSFELRARTTRLQSLTDGIEIDELLLLSRDPNKASETEWSDREAMFPGVSTATVAFSEGLDFSKPSALMTGRRSSRQEMKEKALCFTAEEKRLLLCKRVHNETISNEIGALDEDLIHTLPLAAFRTVCRKRRELGRPVSVATDDRSRTHTHACDLPSIGTSTPCLTPSRASSPHASTQQGLSRASSPHVRVRSRLGSPLQPLAIEECSSPKWDRWLQRGTVIPRLTTKPLR